MHSLLRGFVAIAFLFAGSVGFAQEDNIARKCGYVKSRLAARTTVADIGEDNYDVKYVKFDLTMSNASTAIRGNVATTAVAIASSLASYVFELSPLLTIDSVLIGGVSLPVASAGVVRTVALPTALPAGTSFTAQVFYHGTPTSGTLGGSLGVNNIASPSWGNRATYTLSESYHANEWWPCKQSLRDKIDSTEMWLTIPDSLKAGSNGMLVGITNIDATHHRYEWKERYPIDYYLVSVAIANYVDYSYYMHFTGSTDSMLVQNYVYSNPATLPFFQTIIDSTGLMIDYFSTLFGRYPFWKEKYGHCMGPLGGGMEHQTMTTLGSFEGTLIAHELGHQWFGDHVTCGTWADIFINEGFASYIEYLFTDHFRGHAAAIADITSQQTNVKTMPNGAVYVDDTTSENRIFDSRLSYDKGSCLLHMLRFVINNDNTFFQVLKNHQLQMHDSTATISDFKGVAQGVAGATVNSMNLDTFFTQWAYKEGYPIYVASWNQTGNDVWIKLDQTTSFPSSVALFLTPIEIKLHSVAGDTVVRVFNNQASQVFHITWNRAMASMVFDPNSWLLYDLTSTTHDPALDVYNVSAPALRISPNPTRTSWVVDNVADNSTLELTDMNGRTLWRENVSGKRATVPADKLATGVYLLRVKSGGSISTCKLVRE